MLLSFLKFPLAGSIFSLSQRRFRRFRRGPREREAPSALCSELKKPKNAILKQYRKLLQMDEVDLEFEDDAMMAVAKKAAAKKTGARALRSIIEEFMMDIMYEIPKDEMIGKVIITKDYIEGKGSPTILMRSNG